MKYELTSDAKQCQAFLLLKRAQPNAVSRYLRYPFAKARQKISRSISASFGGLPRPMTLLQTFGRQGSAISAVAFAQLAQTFLKPRPPGPVPIESGETIAVVGGVIHPALSKD
jgi:hypothetical protein